MRVAIVRIVLLIIIIVNVILTVKTGHGITIPVKEIVTDLGSNALIPIMAVILIIVRAVIARVVRVLTVEEEAMDKDFPVRYVVRLITIRMPNIVERNK